MDSELIQEYGQNPEKGVAQLLICGKHWESKTPTPTQIEAGQQVASELYDVAIELALGTTAKAKEMSNNSKFKEIIDLYIAKKIVSVTAIYLAMQSTE